jgi:DNA-binding NarL/FixJ family response regulator
MQTESGPAARVRVVLVDADDRVRESLCGLLCIGERVDVVGSTGRPETALDLVVATRPDIVVLDPRLPDVDAGLSFIDRLHAMAPDVRVLVLSTTEPDDRGDLAAVADGFVRKTFRPSDLVAAVLAATIPLVS